MFINNIEIYFYEDEKSVRYTFEAPTLEEVKAHDIDALIDNAGHQYSMMTSEVVVTSIIEDKNGYVDSDECFRTFTNRNAMAA